MYIKQLFSPKHLFIKTIFFVLFTLLIIVLSFSLYRSSQPYHGVTDSIPISPTPSPYIYPSPSAPNHAFQVIVPDFWTEEQEIADRKDWKLYVDEKFSFSYPNTWKVFKCDTVGNGTYVLFASPEKITCNEIGRNMTLFRLDESYSGFESLNFFKPDKTSNILVGGEQGLSALRVDPHVENLDQVLSPYLMNNVIVPHKNIFYDFTLQVFNDPNSDAVHTFHRILYTFKFKN